MANTLHASLESASGLLDGQVSVPERQRPYALRFGGVSIPPPDMMEAARKSLSEQAFADLMEQTGGRAPTPDELCKMADACRQASRAS